MHLRELELRLRARSLWESGVADDVSQGLPAYAQCISIYARSCRPVTIGGLWVGDPFVPFWLIALEDLALRVVADDLRIDKAAQIEPLRSKLRHLVCILGSDGCKRGRCISKSHL